VAGSEVEGVVDLAVSEAAADSAEAAVAEAGRMLDDRSLGVGGARIYPRLSLWSTR